MKHTAKKTQRVKPPLPVAKLPQPKAHPVGHFARVSPAYHRFILDMTALGWNPSDITRFIADPDIQADWGLVPRYINHVTVWRIVQKIKTTRGDELEARREHYKRTLMDLPLATRQSRIMELGRIYKRSDDAETKLRCLKQIADEVGEGLDKILEAARGSSVPDVVVNVYNDLNADEQDIVDRTAGDFLARRSTVSRLSSN